MESIPFEIICLDDCSTKQFPEHEKLKELSFVRVEYLDENLGRAGIRNLLTKKAVYPTLLFLDADMFLPDSFFIQRYVSALNTSVLVVVGGVCYGPKLPDQSKRVHYTNGVYRESKLASKRTKNPYGSFLTGNVLIKKTVFECVQFASYLKAYGHEDTLFGLELKSAGIPILHIDNPALHEGLESNELFIQKQYTAVENLAFIYKKGVDLSESSLVKVYERLESWLLIPVFCFLFSFVEQRFRTKLSAGKVIHLRYLDLLKLYWFAIQLKK